MGTSIKEAFKTTFAVGLLLLAVVACGDGPTAPTGSLEVTSGESHNGWVTGTVTYRERIALTPGARLEVELRDVSLADAAAPLIARQVIENPGQVPIRYRVGYNKSDIKSRNTYSVSASIIEADGRLAFTNDTVREVITGGNPDKADMVLVLVEPPPVLVEQSETDDWRTWIEVPVRPNSAEWIPGEPELMVMVRYFRSTTEGCSRPGTEALELDGNNLRATVTLMQPPPTAWAIPCDDDLIELDNVARTQESLKPGEAYRIIVNGQSTSSFYIPEADFGHSVEAPSLVESAAIEILESFPPQYQLRVVSGMPKGSGCSRFNGYQIDRTDPTNIVVEVTHHELADEFVICTTDFPIVETTIPLGSGFQSGVEYTVVVNEGTEVSFVAQ